MTPVGPREAAGPTRGIRPASHGSVAVAAPQRSPSAEAGPVPRGLTERSGPPPRGHERGAPLPGRHPERGAPAKGRVTGVLDPGAPVIGWAGPPVVSLLTARWGSQSRVSGAGPDRFRSWGRLPRLPLLTATVPAGHPRAPDLLDATVVVRTSNLPTRERDGFTPP